MKTTTPLLFYRQISKNISIVFLMIVLSAALIFSLYNQRENQFNEVVKRSLAPLQKQQQSQLNLATYLPLFEKALLSKTSKDLLIYHSQIHDNLQRLTKKNSELSHQLNQLLVESNSMTNDIKIMSNLSAKNEQLRKSSFIQLQLVSDSLNSERIEKSKLLAVLYQQITNDEVKDSVTISRAKAHAATAQYLNELRIIQDNLDSALDSFEILDIHMKPSTFENMSEKIKAALVMWKQVLKTLDEKNNITLTEQFFTLDNLLFGEHNTLLKWQEYIGFSQEYFVQLAKQRQDLESLLITPKFMTLQNNDTITLNKYIPEIITTLLAKVKLRVNYQQYYLALISLLFICISVLLFSLIALKRSIKRYNLSNIAYLEKTLIDKNVEVEHVEPPQLVDVIAQLADVIAQVDKTEDSEEQYKQLLERQRIQAKYLAEKNNICYWQYKLDELYLPQQLLLTKIIDPENSFTRHNSWRAWFDHSNTLLILLAAKQAKTTSTSQSIIVENKNNHFFCITLEFKEGLLSGTIVNADGQQRYQQNIEQLEKSLVATKVEASVEQKIASIENSNKLAQMITRTMLQSQSVSIGSGVTSIQVYRQLTRIFDWCRQHKIKTQLEISDKTVHFSNVSFIDELHASIFNAMVEAQLQRNTIILACDEQLLSHAKLDARLFNRMIIGLCRLLLLDQYKSTLFMQTLVVDTNSGQQFVRFNFSVQTNNDRSTLPTLLECLVNEDSKNQELPEVVSYLKTLLFALNCREIQANINDDGFQLAVEMPIIIGDKNYEHNNVVDLQQANILLISDDKTSQKVISTYIKQANAHINILSPNDNISAQLSVERVMQQTFDIVMVGADCTQAQLTTINELIALLPTNIQPKIMVLQSAYNSALQKQGLYAQANAPLCQQSLIESLQKLHQGEARSNCLISADIMEKQQFMPSQVELLLAVKCPQHHQTLIRALHWLGIQVQVVCQATAMTKHWQSGRYLLLITELSTTPFVDMSVGQSVNRAIFTLNKDVQKLFDKQIDNHIWKITPLASHLQINKFIEQLKPWLKKKLALTTEFILPKNATTNITTESNVSTAVPVEEKPLNKSKNLLEEQNKSLSTLELTPHNNGDLIESFDLTEYASNQGSAELAAFMLDEYLANIDQYMTEIDSALTEKNAINAEQSNTEMRNVLKILSATDYISVSLAFEQALKVGNSEDTTKLYQELQQQQQAAISYAEAI